MAFWCKGKKGYCLDDSSEACNTCQYEDGSGGIELDNDDDDYVFIGQWISVEDRLPEEGQSVIVHYVDGWMPVAHLLNGKWYQSGGETSWLSVTHWMPLPEAPKEGENA